MAFAVSDVRDLTQLLTLHPEWLAMKVSSVIDRDDVERARRRADLLRRAGFDAIPAVAGGGIDRGRGSSGGGSPAGRAVRWAQHGMGRRAGRVNITGIGHQLSADLQFEIRNPKSRIPS